LKERTEVGNKDDIKLGVTDRNEGKSEIVRKKQGLEEKSILV
jgi:hypothetical protein